MSMPRVRDLIVRAYNFVTGNGSESKVDENTAPNSIMETNSNNKGHGNVDSVELSGSDFEKYCRRNKISEAELSKDIRGSLGPSDKMNSSEVDVKKAKQCLESAYSYLSANDNKVDIKELKDLAEQYYIATSTGWSIEEFQKEQDKAFKINHSVSSAYKKYCLKNLKFGKLFADDITADKEFFKEYIKDAFVNINNEAIKSLKVQGNNNPTPADIETAKKQLQIKIFGRMLANTKKEDRDILMKAVKELYSENRYDAVHTTLSASANKTNAAHLYLEDRHEICEGMNANETTQMQELGYHYAAKDDASRCSQEDIEIAKNFFTENNINPDELRAKIDSGEALSDIEQEATHYLSMLSGAQVGISGNVVMTSTEINDVMSEYNKNLTDNKFYETVTQMSSSYLEQNKETGLVTKEEFIKQMNSSLPDKNKLFALPKDEEVSSHVKTDNKLSQEISTEIQVKSTENGKSAASQDNSQKPAVSSQYTVQAEKKESVATNPFRTITSIQTTEKKEEKEEEKEVTAESLIEDFGTVKAVAKAVGKNNYKQSVVNNLMSKFEHANNDIKSQMIAAADFSGAGVLIRATSQSERGELVQSNSKLSSTRKDIIRKQYIYDDKVLNSSNTKSFA